jgi:hypothetical protein
MKENTFAELRGLWGAVDRTLLVRQLRSSTLRLTNKFQDTKQNKEKK